MNPNLTVDGVGLVAGPLTWVNAAEPGSSDMVKRGRLHGKEGPYSLSMLAAVCT
jgi:hypothetical protein